MSSYDRQAPDAWKPCLLAGAIGLSRWFMSPGKAYETERKEWRGWRAHRELARLGIVRHFEGYPANAFPPRYDDLLNIYKVVMERRPEVIVELGGGFSTIIIAHAVAERGGKSIFWSVDESAYWQALVRDHLPDSLRPLVQFHHCEPELREVCGEMVSAFPSLPVEVCNLLYVDGGTAPGNAIGADAVLLEEKAPVDYAILVDGRAPTRKFLRRNLKRKYKVEPGPVGVQTLFTPL